jgi:hypothetical protein
VSALLLPAPCDLPSRVGARERLASWAAPPTAEKKQTTDRARRLPVPAQNSNYLENGRYYHGYRRGIYQYPCDEVSGTWRNLVLECGLTIAA